MFWKRGKGGKSGGHDQCGDGDLPAWAKCFETRPRLDRFLTLVARHFDGLGVEIAAGDGVVVETESETIYGLSNIAQICAFIEPDEWSDAIGKHFREVASTMASAEDDDLPQDFELVRGRLVLRLWATSHVDDWDHELVRFDPIPGLTAVLMVDSDHSARAVRAEDAEPWGVEPQELLEEALDNVARIERSTSACRLSEDSDHQIMIFEGESIYAAALALRPEVIRSMSGRYGALVSVPVRNVIFSVPINSVDFISELGAMINLTVRAEEIGPGSVSPGLWWVRDDAWTSLPYSIAAGKIEFTPPEEFNEMVRSIS